MKERRQRMSRVIAAIAMTIMLMPCPGLGEEKLLVTDLLEKGEKEIDVSLSYIHEFHDISYKTLALKADRSFDAVFSTYRFNVGLGHGFEVGASSAYIFSEKTKIAYPTVPPRTQRFSRDGFADISLTGKYLIFDETEKPFTLVGGLDVKLDTASEDDGGTGTTNIGPYVAASTTVAEDIRPFVLYAFVARNHGSKDSHEFVLGAEKEITQDVGVRAFLEADFHTASDYFESYETYYAGALSYIRIRGNVYAVPRVVYGRLTSSEEKESDRTWEAADRLRVTLGIYCLF
jgi:hypothetical protein